MKAGTFLLGAVAGLVACNQSAEEQKTDQARPAAAPKKKVPYCFFKDAETKGWTASTDATGDVVVKGKAYRADGRYKAVLGDPEVAGASASVRPSVTTNDTGHSMAHGWWDVSLTIPNSTAVQTVAVRCGDKLVAELPVKRK